MSNVADALSRLTPEQRAIVEKKLQQKRAQKEAATGKGNRIQPRPQDAGYPLSAGQERLFSLSQFTLDATTYNITEAVRLTGSLNVAALEQSIAKIVERHESLRAHFLETDEGVLQNIAPFDKAAFKVTPIEEQDKDAQEVRIRQILHAEQSRPFDLGLGPLYQFNLLVLDNDSHVLVLTMHHMIADAWSFGVLFKELSQNYGAAAANQLGTVEPLPIQYADFAFWQTAWLQSPEAQAQLDYWQETLASGLEPLQLPISHSQPQDSTSANAGGVVQKQLDPSLVTTLQSVSRDTGVTLFITLLAGFKATLYRYTEQKDMVVCAPTVGRKQVETEGLIGYFNNIVPLRTDLSGNPTIEELQERIQHSMVAAYDHDEIPFQQVASLPQLARTPLTRALFTLQDGLNEALVLPGLEVKSIDVGSISSDFDVALYMEWTENNLVASLEFKTAILDNTQALSMLDKLGETLQEMAESPAIRLQEFARVAEPRNDKRSINAALNAPGVAENGTSPQPHLQGYTNGSITAANVQNAKSQETTQPDTIEEPTEFEAQLIQIWEEVLGLEGVRRTDNFFELGGHSMSALRLFTRIEQEVTQEKLPLALLLQAPTVAQMAQAIRGDDSQKAWSLVVPLQEKGSKPPLFCIHAAGGNVLLYKDLARHLAESDQPVYGIQSQGLDGKKPILKTVEEMAEVYVEEILAVQPTGPYLLTGYCLGGTVAFDVAQRLIQRGHHVAFLGLLETYNWANLKEQSLIDNLRYQSQRAEFMVRNFMMLDSEQRQGFLRGKIERVQGRTSVWRGSVQSMLGQKSGSDEARSDDAILAELWESNDTAADAYVPSNYPGKITQFIPAKDYAEYDDPSLSWDDIARGGVDVHKLAVYPAGMVYEPFVRTLSNHIADCVENGLKNTKVK